MIYNRALIVWSMLTSVVNSSHYRHYHSQKWQNATQCYKAERLVKAGEAADIRWSWAAKIWSKQALSGSKLFNRSSWIWVYAGQIVPFILFHGQEKKDEEKWKKKWKKSLIVAWKNWGGEVNERRRLFVYRRYMHIIRSRVYLLVNTYVGWPNLNPRV